MSGSVNDSIGLSSIMDRGKKEERIVDIYITAEAVRDLKHKKEMEESKATITKPPGDTGSENVRIRRYRSVTVCLVLLCVLLLTAVIVLCVLINTNNQQCHIKTKNLTEERDQLLTKYTNIKEEKKQLLTKYTNIKEEKDQLLTKYTNLTEERDQLLLNYKNLTTENDRLLTNLNKQREQFSATLEILKADGWKEYQSSLYLISSVKKSWSEGKRYCRERGADLIIINNRQEQDYFKKMSGTDYWIGLYYNDEEGKWKWVDGSTVNTRFWDNSSSEAEPNGEPNENCAATYLQGWADYSCTKAFKWICEKKRFKYVVK